MDYGLLAFNSLENSLNVPDIRIVISARITSYIAAGIPVIIDDTWQAVVESSLKNMTLESL